MNKVILIGNIGRDAELKTFETGHSIATTSLATNDGTKDKPLTTWHNLVFWNKLAESAGKLLKKGTTIAIEGRIQVREYTKDDKPQRLTEIVVDRWEFAGKAEKPSGEAHKPSTDEDDLPF